MKKYDSSQIDLNRIDYVVFTTELMKASVFGKNHITISPSNADILESEVLLNRYIERYNSKVEKRFNSLNRSYQDLNVQNIEIEQYGRQYLFVVAPNKHKLVYINCFCNPSEFEYRKRDWVFVLDGGNCFFNIIIDLTEKRVKQFSENGYA